MAKQEPMSEEERRFYEGFTPHKINRPEPKLGDRVMLTDPDWRGTTGTVTKVGVSMPWGPCVHVDRDDGTGAGIYTIADLRILRNRR